MAEVSSQSSQSSAGAPIDPVGGQRYLAPGAAAPDDAQPTTVPLKSLLPHPQTIECPNCQKTSKTVVEGRSDKKRKFMNVFWWPLPGRETWWETTRWSCSNCSQQLAQQKNGKDLQVLEM